MTGLDGGRRSDGRIRTPPAAPGGEQMHRSKNTGIRRCHAQVSNVQAILAVAEDRIE